MYVYNSWLYKASSDLVFFFKWKTNEVIGKDVHENVTEYHHQTARFHRAHLHQALLKHVPRDIIQLNKHIVSVDIKSKDSVVLKFKDGTVVTADVLLGADGLRSVTFLRFMERSKS